MAKVFLTTQPNGIVSVSCIGIDPDGLRLVKTMFELSRDGTDRTTHFDPEIHTLASIGQGVLGHRPLVCREIDESELPYHVLGNGDPTHDFCLDPNCHDRYFRRACEDSGVNIVVNMPKARIIHMDRIREVRNAELAKLDVPFMRALEAGDTAEQQRIGALKQELRDIPQTFSLSGFRTPNTLKEAWPQGLPR